MNTDQDLFSFAESQNKKANINDDEISPAKKRIDFLRKEIAKHDYLYYVLARPIIGDRDYDILWNELLELEKAHPEYYSPTSPTQRVSGEPQTGFKQVRHDPPMQSLDKTHAKNELSNFDDFIKKEISDFTYCVEPKIDGLSISLRYENHVLVRAATRGNGTIGDDVTANVKTIRAVPLTLPDDAPNTIEVRGEIYMTREGFVKLNEKEEELGREPFANPRNAAAGSLKQLDARVTASRPLSLVVYNAGGDGCENFLTHEDMLKAFSNWGFPVVPWLKNCSSIEEVFSAIDELELKRHSFPFEIDGAVIKVNERKHYASLGATAHGPRWARAYKYAPDRAETIVEDITVQVGRTGILTPVAELKPVALSGSIISRATLHNADQISRQDIRVGDHVWLVKAGDVIPAIESSIPEKRNGDEIVFVMPTKCPVCNSDVIRLEGEVATRCINPSCSAQLQRRVEHFASRNALNINALGGKIADALVERGIIKDPLDLFTLDYDALADLDIGENGASRKFGRNAENIRLATEDARKAPLDRWLFAIGIPNVGTTVAKDIANEHEKLSDLADSAVLKNVLANAELKQKERKILPIKVEAAKAVLEYFASEYGQNFLKRLDELGIEGKAEKQKARKSSGPLVGATCVLTGTLSRPRNEYAKLIEEAGGIIQSAVTSKTQYLIAGENTGATKTEKARALGTKVINEKELIELLAQ